MLLFDGGAEPLASFGPKLSASTSAALRTLGVELHMGSVVTDVHLGGLKVRDREGNQQTFNAATVLWTAGVAAPPFASAVAKATGASQDRAGRIEVRDDLTIEGHPEISVVGDVMSLRNLPGVAEVAMQAGHYAARRISRGGRRGTRTAPRSSTAISARPPTSPAAAPSSRRAAPADRFHRLGLLAVHPHRVPDRVPQPRRRHPHLVGGVHEGRQAGACVHRARDRPAAERLRVRRPAAERRPLARSRDGC